MRALLLVIASLGAVPRRQVGGGPVFDDMISRALQVVTAEPSLPGKFLHVIVDEFRTPTPAGRPLGPRTPRQGQPLPGGRPPAVHLPVPPCRAGHLHKKRWRPSRATPLLVNLDVTFRSRQAVMDAVNSLFGRVWEGGRHQDPESRFSRLAPEFAGLVAETPGDHRETLRDRDPAGESRPRSRSVKYASAMRLADRIVGAVDSGATVWDTDGEGPSRPGRRFRDLPCWFRRGPFTTRSSRSSSMKGHTHLLRGQPELFGRGEVRDAVRLLGPWPTPATRWPWPPSWLRR